MIDQRARQKLADKQRDRQIVETIMQKLSNNNSEVSRVLNDNLGSVKKNIDGISEPINDGNSIGEDQLSMLALIFEVLNNIDESLAEIADNFKKQKETTAPIETPV